MKTLTINTLILVVTIGVTVAITLWVKPAQNLALNPPQAELTPSYWVAPMDNNYRRDKPGKSPMGMKLIPVYKNAAAKSPNNKQQAGQANSSLYIDASVVNNLGIRTAVAQLSEMKSHIKTVGNVQFNEEKLVHIHPRVEGWVDTLYVKATGEAVSKGQPLYSLYSPQLVNAQEELVLATKQHNTRLIKAAEQRLKALQINDNIIATLKKTGIIQQTLTFNAPQTGVVDQLSIREGFFVKPGTTLMSIASLDSLWVEVDVLAQHSALVTKGLAATINLAHFSGSSPSQWQGRVDYVYPSLNPITRTLRARLVIDNTGENAYTLKPNMFANVTIATKPQAPVIRVPRDAVIRTGLENRVVLQLSQGEFKTVRVGIGRINHQFAEIVSGIKVGDTVVISGQFLLDSESSKTSDFMRIDQQQSIENSVGGNHD